MFLAAGVAVAIDPHVEGREPTPIAREFHLADAPPAVARSVERQQREREEQVREWVLFFFRAVP